MSDTIAPFEFRFDYTDSDHHRFAVEVLVKEATYEALAALGEDLEYVDMDDIEDVIERARELPAAEADAAIRDDLDHLEQCARQCLTYQCCCASDAWDSEHEWLDTLLGELPDEHWAYTTRHEHDIAYLDGQLSYEKLYQLSDSRRDGWEDLTARWDGERLEITFRAYGGGTNTVTATAVRGAHLDAFEMLEQRAFSDDQAVTWAMTRTLDDVRAALGIAETLDDDGILDDVFDATRGKDLTDGAWKILCDIAAGNQTLSWADAVTLARRVDAHRPAA